MKKLIWNFVRPSTTRLFTIPSKPGIYAFVYNFICFDLLIQREVIYVGKSKNLRRRIKEHIVRETNDELRSLKLDEIQIAYTQANEDDLSLIESSLYRILTPSANKISPPTGGTELTQEDQQKLLH
tara:strand:+ start:299 stop:676 length:378 start_codon:yes stop_codon:yes gene_type:complete